MSTLDRIIIIRANSRSEAIDQARAEIMTNGYEWIYGNVRNALTVANEPKLRLWEVLIVVKEKGKR